MQRLWRWRNSIGSSIVMMCSARVRLISSISAASVVDLPEPVGPVDEDEPARLVADLVERRGKPELLEALQLGGNQPEGAGEALALRVDVDAEAGDAGDRVGEVELAVDLETLLLLARDDPVEELPGRVRAQHRERFEALQLAAYTQRRLRADGDVQIGRVVRDHLLEQGVDGESVFRHGSPSNELSAAKRSSLNCF